MKASTPPAEDAYFIGDTVNLNPVASNLQATRKPISKVINYREEAKYKKLIESLEAVNKGEMKATIKQLASKYKVSPDTIYRIKNCIFRKV